MKKTLYRKVFSDIVSGYSLSEFNGNTIYIRHLSTHDQVNLEDIESSFYESAKDRGLPTEEEALKSLKADHLWTQEDEDFISRQSSYVENLIKGKSHLILKSQIDQQNKLIEEESGKLNIKTSEKDSLFGNTCEKYSKQRVNDHYIIESLFLDLEMKKKLFTENELDDVGYKSLHGLIEIHNKNFQMFSEDNIQNLILQDFYYPYMPFSEDSMQFYGIPVCNLTHNQLQLLIYTRVFKNITDRHDNIPEHIKKDPKALLDFAASSEKGKEMLHHDDDKGGASTIIGATKEDYEYMGVSSKGVSLHDAAEKKGGKLDMQDLMDLAGT